MKNKEHKEKTYQEFYKDIGSNHAESTAKEADDLIEKSKDLDFPEELDIWFDKYFIDDKKDKKKDLKIRFSSFAKRAAVFLIVLALSGLITTMSVEAYRIRFFNLITEMTDNYTNISVERETDENNKKNNTLEKSYFYPTHIPSGYKKSDEQSYGELRIINFDNEKGDIIEFLQTKLDPNFQVDTEGATTVEININGSKGILVSKEDLKTLLWATDANNFYITGNLDQKEIIFMAESLEIIR